MRGSYLDVAVILEEGERVGRELAWCTFHHLACRLEIDEDPKVFLRAVLVCIGEASNAQLAVIFGGLLGQPSTPKVGWA